MSRSAPRVLIGPQEISGFYENLELGMLEIGVRARLVTMHPHPFGYGQASRNPWPARLASWAVLLHRRSSSATRLLAGGLYVLSGALLLLWSLPRFDAYLFAWGTSLLPGNIDIPVLRLFRKRVVVVVGHGSEARPPYMSSPADVSAPVGTAEAEFLADATAKMAQKMGRIGRWATAVVGLPTTGQLIRVPFVDFYRLGLPTPRPASPNLARGNGDTIRVLHIPSNPGVKGSQFIRECVQRVALRHPRVEFVEITGRPHEEVLNQLTSCSFVVDQLWSDIPMAIVGTEAAALGTPSVISGYAWSVWEERLDADSMPPAFLTTPEDLEDTIEQCVVQASETRAMGERAQHFVLTQWAPATVAARYLRVLEGDIPEEWMVHPASVTYAWGVGVPRRRVLEMARAIAAVRGVEALKWAGAAEAYGLSDPSHQTEAAPRT